MRIKSTSQTSGTQAVADDDGVSKHLRVMRAAGVLASKRGEDRRLELYHIPESIRRVDGVVDLGFCAIRFPARDPMTG